MEKSYTIPWLTINIYCIKLYIIECGVQHGVKKNDLSAPPVFFFNKAREKTIVVSIGETIPKNTKIKD
jgi:hypothetical protein